MYTLLAFIYKVCDLYIGNMITTRKMGYHGRIFVINIRKLAIYHKNMIDT